MIRFDLNPSRDTQQGTRRGKMSPRARRGVLILGWVGLSAVLWLMQTFSLQHTVEISIPIVYKGLPKAYGVEGEEPAYVSASLSGKGGALFWLWVNPPKAVELDLSKVKIVDGQILFSNVTLAEKVREQVGGGLNVQVRYPDNISLRPFKLHSKVVPVVPHVTVSPAGGYTIMPLIIEPKTVNIYGSRESLDAVREVNTVEQIFSGVEASRIARIAFEELPNIRIAPDSATLRIKVEELTEKRIDLPVSAINIPEGFVAKVLPARVSVQLTMPISAYDKTTSSGLWLEVDLSEIEARKQRGEPLPDMLPIVVRGMPDWIVSASVSPKAVQYLLEPIG